METTIANLEQFGNGWQWAQTNEIGEVCRYRTNQHGEGVWQMEVDFNGKETDWKQIVGNTQFSVSANRTTARNQIKRWANR